jgi:uncharacterized protein (TIGR00730 family)
MSGSSVTRKASRDRKRRSVLQELLPRVQDPAVTGREEALVREMLETSLKLLRDATSVGDLKILNAALRELRYAFKVFAPYRGVRKVSVFGSARTPPGDAAYRTAAEFSREIASHGYMIVTGGGHGIMRACQEGAGRERSFGVNIRLPFEQDANEFIQDDPKLVTFRYFFTRKLMFLSQAEAVALFPGGFGTMDEAYEALTLIQTGKSSMIPIVLLEGAAQNYWEQWDNWVRASLLSRGLISPEDIGLYKIFSSPEDAVAHILRFYRNYHSSRYVQDDLIIRVRKPLRQVDLDSLSDEFKAIIKQGKIVQRGPYDAEDDHLDLPRLAFTHTRSKFAFVRRLIDRINECDPA